MQATNAKGYRANWALRLAAAVFCLVLLTTHLLSGMMYARYMTSDSAEDGARVAAFVFDIAEGSGRTVADLSDIHVPGNSQTLELIIKNSKDSKTSEVAQRYTVTLTELGSLPLMLIYTDKDGQEQNPVVDESGKKVEFTDVFAAKQGEEKSHRITVKWPTAADGAGYAQYTDAKYAGGAAYLEVHISVEQVD